ncbi:hypothetical protein INR49_028047 [Caranx melampygus]|nr:hypothetical protein INR49_028047 [Caranx melampygus]
MLYTELLKLWDESVQAVDAKDWQGALEKLEKITEPTSRTLFNSASANLALGQLEEALKALDLTIAKDERLAVGFFQRSAVMMQVDRLEEALSDCIWAQKYLRGNMVIDYKQLGLRYKLYSWQVLYNAAAVYSRMGDWSQATEVLMSASQERGGGRGGNIEVALESVARKEILAPLVVPEDVVFRPRKQDVEQLQQRDFLGKAKVGEDFCQCRYWILQIVFPVVFPSHQVSNLPPVLTPGPALQLLLGQTSSAQADDEGSVVVKVHYTYTVALSVPLDTPYHEVKEQIAQKLGQPASQLRLRHKEHGSRVLIPLSGEPGHTIQEVAEAGRATLWCQTEDPLANRNILYQMVALYDYTAQGPEDLEFSEGDTIDILVKVRPWRLTSHRAVFNEEWLEGHCAGNIGIFPSSFAYRENTNIVQSAEL